MSPGLPLWVPCGTCGGGRDTGLTDKAGQGGRPGKGRTVCREDEDRVHRSGICDEPWDRTKKNLTGRIGEGWHFL